MRSVATEIFTKDGSFILKGKKGALWKKTKPRKGMTDRYVQLHSQTHNDGWNEGIVKNRIKYNPATFSWKIIILCSKNQTPSQASLQLVSN